jgi:hypothetical protein
MATLFSSRKRIFWIAAAVVGVAVISVVMARARKPSELAVYTTAADRMSRGEEIYRPTDRKAFTYPPFFAIPFMPMNVLPESYQPAVWWAINLSLVGLSAWLLLQLTAATRERGDRGPAAIWWCAGITALLSAKFMLLPLVYGSHDLLILVLMLASGLAFARGRQFSSGLAGGIATACKATPLLLLPLLIWQRKWRATGMFVAALFVATFLPDLLFPHPNHKPWVEYWYSRFVAKVHVGSAPDASGAWKEWNELNQSLAGTVHRLATPAPSRRAKLNVAVLPVQKDQVKFVTLGLDGLVLAFCAWLSWPRKSLAVRGGDQGFMSLGYTSAVLCGMLLLSPMSSTYHFCLLLPPIAFLVTYWIYCEHDWIVGGAIVSQLAVGLLSGDLFGLWADVALAGGLYTFAAAIQLAACGYVLGWRMPREAEAERIQMPPKAVILQPPTAAQINSRTPSRRAKAA